MISIAEINLLKSHNEGLKKTEYGASKRAYQKRTSP